MKYVAVTFLLSTIPLLGATIFPNTGGGASSNSLSGSFISINSGRGTNTSFTFTQRITNTINNGGYVFNFADGTTGLTLPGSAGPTIIGPYGLISTGGFSAFAGQFVGDGGGLTNLSSSFFSAIVSNNASTVGQGGSNFVSFLGTNKLIPSFNIVSNGSSYFGFPVTMKSQETNLGGFYASSTAFFDGITLSNSGNVYGLGSSNIFEIRNTNSGALAPSLAVSTNGLAYGNTMWSIVGFGGTSLTTTTNYGYIVGGTFTTVAGDITNKAVKLGRDVYISWFNCRVGAAPVGGTNYTFTIATNGNLSGIGAVITGNGVNQEGSATFSPPIKIPGNTLVAISIVATATGPAGQSTSWAFGQ